MKITIEFDTEVDGYDPHDVWLIFNAKKMWTILCELKNLFREYCKYQAGAFSRTQPEDDFKKIVHDNHMAEDDFE